MKWFKHESDAHKNHKLEKVLMKYGAEGYALYWMCLEAIAAPIDKHNLTFELKHDAEILAFRLKMDSLRVEEIMRYMVSLNLFEIDDTTKTITCLKLAERIENSIIKNPQLKEIQGKLSGKIPDSPGKSGLDIDKTRLEENKTTIGNSGAVTDCPHDEIISLYHELLPVCPQVRVWTDKRKKMLRARWREDGKRQNVEWWKKYFSFVASCDFLVGKGGGERPFFADLEWLVNPSNMVKVIEGKYQNAQ